MATLPENDRLTGPLIALAGQVAFDADFPLIDAPGDAAGSCVVFLRDRGGAATELTLGDFSVSGASESGFVLNLAVAAEAGDRCFIVGRQRQARLRAHPSGGAIRTPTLEDDAREAAARAQEARRDLDRGVLAPIGEPGITLAAEADRDGKLPVFADGGVGFIDTPERLVAIDSEGKAYGLALVATLNEIGAVFEDDGLWEANGGVLTHDDGVFS